MKRGVALVGVVVAAVLLPAGPAAANVGVSATLTMPAGVAVGQTVSGSFTVSNINTPPHEAISNTITSLRLAPTCGAVGSSANPCPVPDPNVFAVAPTATGRVGTACAGRTFSVSAPDAGGVVTFTPSSPVALSPPGGLPGSSSCTVDYTLTVVRVPTIDVNPGAGGIQSQTNFVAQTTGAGLTPTISVSTQVTVGRGTATLTTQASPSVRVGGVIFDQATVGGIAGAALPGGTVTFRAFGPNDVTCTGPVFAQATNPLANGTATSGQFVVSQPGVYRWVASYSGDANYLPAGPTACGDPAERVSVTRLQRPPADFDGDAKTDVSAFRPSNGGWYVHQSSGGDTGYRYGGQGDLPVPGDYDGDGKTDIAVFRPTNGGWYIHLSGGGDVALAYGAPGDVPVPGDYDGDGKTDIAAFRPSNGGWYVHQSTGGDTGYRYGGQGDVPVPGDYDGDGKTDIAVFRPTNGGWYIHLSGGGDVALAYGAVGDVPVPGDYDGDGKADIAAFRPSNGGWYVHQSSGGDTGYRYGGQGDMPVPGNYDGDGKTDIAVFRPTTGTWYIHRSAGGDVALTYGAVGDVPLPLPASIRTAFFS